MLHRALGDDFASLQADTGRSRAWRHLAFVALVIVLSAVSVGTSSPAFAGTGAADPHIDRLAEGAGTPTLDWADCGDGFVCAAVGVPLDYNRPHDEQIELSVIKLPATDARSRIGTLFVNFGGPGQSGVDRLRGRARWPWLFSEELRSRFDLVSWDQRGVARSAAVRCFSDSAEQWQVLVPSPGLPMDARGEQELFDWSENLAERCEQQAGPILNHVSSANAARDLELLRRAVGDSSLTYHGISYGTQLGAIYANLFPGRVRAMALDGSIDFEGNVNGHGPEGNTVPLNARQDVATGTSAAFEEFLRDCSAADRRCAFSEGEPRAKWAALVERSRLSPVFVYGHAWTYPEMVAATLAKPSTYPQLAELLQQFSDAGTAAPELIDAITGSDPPPADVDRLYLSNREEAYDAIQCTDSTVPTDLAAYTRAALTADAASPDFGRISVFDVMPCAFWRGHDADRYTGPWNRRTSAPILVLNTRNDPATPLAGAYAGAAQLYEARVVVTEGAGHTSMYVASTCAERVKREYLFSGLLPPRGNGCSRDHSPFDQAPAVKIDGNK
ncbi:alpha/beta hydrolase [Mycobacterium sp. IDR2000157661]|nr:alpha/beta hydrolase [Mycobacterium sp. IDR2000157661]